MLTYKHGIAGMYVGNGAEFPVDENTMGAIGFVGNCDVIAVEVPFESSLDAMDWLVPPRGAAPVPVWGKFMWGLGPGVAAASGLWALRGCGPSIIILGAAPG